MSTRRILTLTITTIAVFGVAAGFSTAAVASPSASGQPTATATVAVVPNYPSTSDRCVNEDHTVPCWALTLASGTFFLRDGTHESIGVNDLVLITCYYTDSSGAIQDHIIAEDAGGDGETGHVADSIVNLNNHNPGMLQYDPDIGTC